MNIVIPLLIIYFSFGAFSIYTGFERLFDDYALRSLPAGSRDIKPRPYRAFGMFYFWLIPFVVLTALFLAEAIRLPIPHRHLIFSIVLVAIWSFAFMFLTDEIARVCQGRLNRYAQRAKLVSSFLTRALAHANAPDSPGVPPSSPKGLVVFTQLHESGAFRKENLEAEAARNGRDYHERRGQIMRDHSDPEKSPCSNDKVRKSWAAIARRVLSHLHAVEKFSEDGFAELFRAEHNYERNVLKCVNRQHHVRSHRRRREEKRQREEAALEKAAAARYRTDDAREVARLSQGTLADLATLFTENGQALEVAIAQVRSSNLPREDQEAAVAAIRHIHGGFTDDFAAAGGMKNGASL